MMMKTGIPTPTQTVAWAKATMTVMKIGTPTLTPTQTVAWAKATMTVMKIGINKE